MRCDKHIDKNDEDYCHVCEELTIKEKKEKYANIICNNSLRRTDGNKEISTISSGLQKTGR